MNLEELSIFGIFLGVILSELLGGILGLLGCFVTLWVCG
jgi:hypothetical protein